MPALWPAFITTVGGFLDLKTPKTEKETADFIINAYTVAVVTSNISTIPGSTILSLPSIIDLKDSLKEVFEKIKKENKIDPATFNNFSKANVDFWKNVKWNPMPPPPGFVGPDPSSIFGPGVQTEFSGDFSYLNTLLNANLAAPPLPGPGGVIVATKLSQTFASHLFTINGFYNGLVPGTPPAPGPPLPWQAVI